MAFLDWLVALIKSLFQPKPVKVGPVIPVKVKQENRDCPWMDLMMSKLGEKEVAGSDDNEFIMSLYKYGRYDAKHDETPWCACAVGWALAETGYKWTKSAAAVSYKNYGDPSKMIRGAIIVFQHPNGKHHVTFFDSILDENHINCLGGNQANTLKISSYDLRKEKIIGCRWPIKQ